MNRVVKRKLQRECGSFTQELAMVLLGERQLSASRKVSVHVDHGLGENPQEVYLAMWF